MEKKSKNELFSINEIQQMTQKFDVTEFYRKYNDYLAVMMITPTQVIVVYRKTDETLCHDEMTGFLCELLTNLGEKSIISISFGYENELWNTFFMKVRKKEKKPTTKMIQVLKLIYNIIFGANDNTDIEHNNIEEFLKKIDCTDDLDTNGCKTIIGIPIDNYILKLKRKSQVINKEEPEL